MPKMIGESNLEKIMMNEYTIQVNLTHFKLRISHPLTIYLILALNLYTHYVAFSLYIYTYIHQSFHRKWNEIKIPLIKTHIYYP